MTRRRIDPELHTLIDAAISGQLTGDQERQLDERLRTDDAALAAFLDYCQLETDLFFHVRAALAGRRFLSDLQFEEAALPTKELAPASTTVATRRWHRAMPVRAAMTLAGMLLLALLGWWASWYWYVIPAERQPQAVAAYLGGDDVKWLDEISPAVGHRFVEGDSVYLTKGRARISMASGAELVLRAPCFVTLSSPERVQLEEGVVTAQVAEWGRGFTVATEALQVVDLGTKFAVSASPRGIAEAHVLNGQVRIQPTTKAVADRRSLLLSGGEAIRVESQRKISTRLAADQNLDAELGDVPPFKPIQMHNTGTGLMPGDEDSHWRITVGPKSEHFQGPEFAVVAEAHARYLANDPGRSQWISIANPVEPGAPANSQFTFETTFNLAGYDLGTVMIAAQVIADNGVKAVRINGKPVSMKPWVLNENQQYFNKFNLVEIKEGFVPGLNKVEFDVWNGVVFNSPGEPNPISLRVEWQGFGRPVQLATKELAIAH